MLEPDVGVFEQIGFAFGSVEDLNCNESRVPLPLNAPRQVSRHNSSMALYRRPRVAA